MNKDKENIEIPFGANDSELCGFEYTIPEGYEAEIKDGKVIVRKAESKNEKIKKVIYGWICTQPSQFFDNGFSKEEMLAWLEKQGQKFAEWSYNDDVHRDAAIRYLKGIQSPHDTAYQMKEETINWLKSLKDRVQPKQEWSEEDERIIYNIEQFLHLVKNNPQVRNDLHEEAKNWLNSLKERYTWKPSEEQIKAVKEAACYSSVFSEKTIDNLISLSTQLKKLKGE